MLEQMSVTIYCLTVTFMKFVVDAWALKLHVLVEVKNALTKLVCYVTEDDICCLACDGRCSKVILYSTISASYPIILYVNRAVNGRVET